MANYFKDNADLQFYFDKWIDWDALAEKIEHGFRFDDGFPNADEAKQFYRDIIEMVGEFVAEEIAPHAEAIDKFELEVVDGEVVCSPQFDEIFEKIKALELHGMCVPRELGGMNVPLVVYMLNAEMMSRADVSVMTHHSFHGGIAMAMLVYSLKEGTTEFDPETRRILKTRFEKGIREIASGQAWGCMDITESDAGSDMAALRAKAVQDAEGNWFVTGQKIFITSGHGSTTSSSPAPRTTRRDSTPSRSSSCRRTRRTTRATRPGSPRSSASKRSSATTARRPARSRSRTRRPSSSATGARASSRCSS